MKKADKVKFGPVVWVVLLAASFAVFTGCATSGFMGFGDPLTTISYVDNAIIESINESIIEPTQRIAEAESETDRIAEEIDDVKANIEELNALRSSIEELLATIEQNKKDTEALQSLAAGVGKRMEQMPVEMLRQLVTALQSYLESVESEAAE
jgi:hypothetical protein